MSDVSEALTGLIADLATAAYADAPVEGAHADLWPQMVELGLDLVGVDEQMGGSGGTLGDAIDLAYALGRSAISSPFIEHSTAFAFIENPELLGESIATVAVSAGDVVESEDGTLSGRLVQVPWASSADHVVILVPGATALLADLRGPSVRVDERINAAGESRDTVVLDRVIPTARLSSASEYSHQDVLNRLGALRAASLAGAVAGAYATTRAYVNEREQFGAPLVKIPAVASNLATVKAELIQAEAALERVRQVTEEGTLRPTYSVAVASARVITARAAGVAARIAHQLHGAMGITVEYPLHRHTRRLWAWRDDELAQAEWAELLANIADDLGEPAMWDLIAP